MLKFNCKGKSRKGRQRNKCRKNIIYFKKLKTKIVKKRKEKKNGRRKKRGKKNGKLHRTAKAQHRARGL